MDKELIQSLKSSLNKTTPFPSSVQAALTEMNKAPVDMNVLCGYLELDPILASTILRLANSPFYGLSREIGTVRDAAVLLGMHSLKQLVISFSLVKTFNTQSDSEFNRQALWQHSVAVATTAKLLAERSGHNSDDAFVAGMLHDIGQFILDQSLGKKYSAVLQYRNEQGCATSIAERKILGIDHGWIGATAIHKWKLPLPFSEVSLRHHYVTKQTPASPMLDLVHVADVLVKGLWISPDNDHYMIDLCPQSLARLRLDWGEIEDLLPKIEATSQDVIERLLH